MSAPLDPESLSHLARSLDRRLSIGQLAVLNGLISPEALEECLREQRASGRPLGGLLVSRRHLTAAELSSLLKEQALLERDGAGRMPEGTEEVERMIGRYALVRRVGSGGAGVVWKAWDTQLERWVAVKEPQLDRGMSTERFLREARAAAQLKHPNLIQIFEVGEQDGIAHIVMDYVEGRRLDELAPDPRTGAEKMARICEAVQAMHSSGVVHRDIKPQNILVDGQGEPHLGDFGLAKMAESSALTVEGGFLGTPQYAAPEQASGKRGDIGPATDVYGLGATLYHVLSGHPPFEGEEALRILDQKRREIGPRPLALVAPSLPRELALIVGRAMESRPGERYPTAAALGEDLRRFLRGESLSIRPPTALDRAWRAIRRHALQLAAAAIVVLAIGGVAALRVGESRRDAAYETARQRGDEWWTRALGFLRTSAPDRDGLRRSLGEAIRAYGEASLEAPSRPYPWLMRGRCHRLLGEKSEAEKAWTKALDLDPSSGPALLERAKLYLSTVANLRVPSTLQAGRFAAPDPESPEESLLRRKGEQDLEAARTARGLEPADLTYLEGMVALTARDFDKAAIAFRTASEAHPWDPSALAMLGASEYYASRFDQADATWSRILALEPTAERHRARGHVRYCLGRFAEAIADYDRALGLLPDSPEIWCDRGTAEQARGNLEQALSDYSKAIGLRPRFARAYNNRGTTRAAKKDFEGAHRDFQEAQEFAPFFTESYVNRGVLFRQQGNMTEAVEEFDAAREIDPNNVDALLHLGACRIIQLEFEKAIADLTKALKLSPGNIEVLYHRAQALHWKGDVAQAMQDLREAMSRAPGGWARRARAEELLQDWSKKP